MIMFLKLFQWRDIILIFQKKKTKIKKNLMFSSSIFTAPISISLNINTLTLFNIILSFFGRCVSSQSNITYPENNGT